MNFEEITLQEEDRKHLAYIMETSLRVHRRSHFFSWTQGPLQTLLPHEILICGLRENPQSPMYLERFTATRYFREEHFHEFCNPLSGLFTDMVSNWQKSGQPCLFPTPELGPGMVSCEPRWLPLLNTLELRNIAGHGVRWADGSVKAFFSFSRLGVPLDIQIAYFICLLIPCIFTTFARVLAEECGTGNKLFNPAIVTLNPLKPREVEVLEWVREGKSNSEIGQILQLSQHTVKNHIQKIMKKLEVKTRGQAVTRAISLGNIKNHP